MRSMCSLCGSALASYDAWVKWYVVGPSKGKCVVRSKGEHTHGTVADGAMQLNADTYSAIKELAQGTPPNQHPCYPEQIRNHGFIVAVLGRPAAFFREEVHVCPQGASRPRRRACSTVLGTCECMTGTANHMWHCFRKHALNPPRHQTTRYFRHVCLCSCCIQGGVEPHSGSQRQVIERSIGCNAT